MAKPKTTNKTTSTASKLKTLTTKSRTLTSENIALKERVAELEKQADANRITDLTSRARKSKTVFIREPKDGDSDVFFGYIRTKNSDGSEYLHKFSRDEITSKFGTVYHQGYKFLITKEEVAARSEAAKAQLADKTAQSAAAEDAAC